MGMGMKNGDVNYTPVWEGTFSYKTYSGNEFAVVEYAANGYLFRTFGGTFQVVGDGKIREIIDYYAPYGNVESRTDGADGQMALISGATMVKSVTELKISIREGKVYMDGRLKQNVTHVKDPSYHSDLAIHGVYEKARP